MFQNANVFRNVSGPACDILLHLHLDTSVATENAFSAPGPFGSHIFACRLQGPLMWSDKGSHSASPL